jgi:hypothetical protein
MLTVVILLSLILVSSAAAVASTPRSHDGGVFLRLSGGFGYASSKIEEGGESLEFSGTSGDVNFAIGGMVTPNLAVHGTLIGWYTTGPEIKVCNGRCETGSDDDLDFSLSGFGGGLTYFFAPSNFYISGSICAAQLTLTYDNVSRDSDYGPAIDISAGKEWWVSDNWGIGVAGGFGYHSVGDPDLNENWSGTSFAVRFSATYN